MQMLANNMVVIILHGTTDWFQIGKGERGELKSCLKTQHSKN